MTGFDAATWETFLRRMVAYNLALFDTTNNSDNNDNNSDNREDKLGKLRRCGAVILNFIVQWLTLFRWNYAQNGLHSMLKLGTHLKDVVKESRGKWTFGDDIR